jgi:hypothetical protein
MSVDDGAASANLLDSLKCDRVHVVLTCLDQRFNDLVSPARHAFDRIRERLSLCLRVDKRRQGISVAPPPCIDNSLGRLVHRALYGRLLSSLRAVRLVRLLRLLRAGTIIGRALQAERRLTSPMMFRTVGLATAFLVVIAGAAQAEINNDEFKSFWDGVWWAVVTVTTVGYGDLYPTSVAGRLIAIAVMFLGIGFLAVLTATIASHFVRAD